MICILKETFAATSRTARGGPRGRKDYCGQKLLLGEETVFGPRRHAIGGRGGCTEALRADGSYLTPSRNSPTCKV